jgi:spore coat protein U-like protein
MNKHMTRLLGAATLGAAIVAASPASAATTPGSLDVSATVTDNCALSTTAVAFGNVDVTSGANNDAAGSISVTCTNGTAWSASADAGAGTGATLASRKMNDGASNLLNYVLYTDSGRTNVWGDGVGGTTALVSGDGTGTADTRTIYGRIPSGQTGVPSGIYGDTVAVTVSY